MRALLLACAALALTGCGNSGDAFDATNEAAVNEVRQFVIAPGLKVEDKGYKIDVGETVGESRTESVYSVPVFADAVGPGQAWLSCKVLDDKGVLVGSGGVAGLRANIGAAMQVSTVRPIAKGKLQCFIVDGTAPSAPPPPKMDEEERKAFNAEQQRKVLERFAKPDDE